MAYDNHDAQKDNSAQIQDEADASLVGRHCQDKSCNRLDFLPFYCQSCNRTFCLDHRSEGAHRCIHAGAWAQRRKLAEQSRLSIGQGKVLREEGEKGKSCASPNCKTDIGTSLVPSIHCKVCSQNYCLKHRMQEDHDCKTITALQPQSGGYIVSEKAKSALDRLRAWGAARKLEKLQSPDTAFRAMTRLKPKPHPAATQILSISKLKKMATGRSDIPDMKRIYFFVEAEAAPDQTQPLKGEFFYSVDWVVGKMLDEAARSLKIQNVNNRGLGEDDKLRVFHVEGGRLLDFGEKLGTALKNGNTIVLLRGVGPPPDLIDP